MKNVQTIGIISPSLVLGERKKIDISRGISYLEGLGYKVKVAPSVYEGLRAYPNYAQDKANDIMEMYQDESIDILLCAHGGAGALHILEYLDYDVIQKNPKPIIGFSDSTSIQMAVYAKTKNPFVTGFLPDYEFRTAEGIHPTVSKTLEKVLNGEKITAKSGKTARTGVCEGVLLGECLSPISDLSGTSYSPSLAGGILLIEDECESSYKIALMLTQLRYRPDFKNVKGIIFGRFSECTDHPTQGSVTEVIDRFIEHCQIPVIKDFNFGHFRERFVLPCGVKYKLDANACILTQIENL